MMMVERKNSRLIGLVCILALSACSAPQPETGFAVQVQPTVVRAAEMESACREEAAHRYNIQPQRISLVNLDRYQGSYEMRGNTAREERFTCSFDEKGRFQHLLSG